MELDEVKTIEDWATCLLDLLEEIDGTVADLQGQLDTYYETMERLAELRGEKEEIDD